MRRQHADAGPDPRRPDPFAFPSDTDFRFGLLVVAVLSATFFIYDVILPNGALVSTYRLCLSQVLATNGPQPTGSLGDIAASGSARAQVLNSCRARAERSRVGEELLALIGVAGLAGAIYAVLPVWRRRRGGYVDMVPSDAPEVVAEVERLADTAGLRSRPRILWNPLNGSAAAIVFGALGRYQLALSGGLVIRFYEDPEVFRAVLRHELAHIRNGDIDKTYLTVAVWYAFAAGALLPFGVSMAFFDHSFLADMFWRIAGLGVVVYLIRNSVLRARESYADVRASFEDGPAGIMSRIIGQSAVVRGGSWRRLWAVHPSPAERQRTITDTASLFRLTFWDAGAVGLTIGLAFPNLELTIGLGTLGFDRSGGVISHGLAALLLSVLLVGVVGSAVWRSAFLSLIDDRRRPASLLPIALGVTAGAVLGHVLSFSSSVDVLGSALPSLARIAIVESVWAVVFTLGTLGLVRWIWAAAETWLRRAPTARSLGRAMTAGLVAAMVLCVPWIGAMFLVRDLVEFAANGGALATVGIAVAVVGLGSLAVLATPALTMLICVSTGFLVAARLVPRPAVTDEAWRYGFIENGPGLQDRDGTQSSMFRRAIVAALIGVAIYTVVMLPAAASWHLLKPRAARSDTDVITYYVMLVALAVLIQGYVAAAITGGGGRFAGLPAVLGALIAGLGMSAVLLLTNLAFGGGLDAGFALQTVCLVVNGGALLALLALPLARFPPGRRSGPVLQAQT